MTVRPASVTTQRDLAARVFSGALVGAAAGPLTDQAIRQLDFPIGSDIWLFAFGKAAPAMASAAVTALERKLCRVRGGIVVGAEPVQRPVGTMHAVRGDHPIPGSGSAEAAARIGEIARGRRGGDVALVLVSGGTSSLIAAPPDGIAQSELAHLYELLLASGLDIRAVNAVRKRFSRWAGGRLAIALAPAATHCLMISDVATDDPSDIGSGPCTPDTHVTRDVVKMLEQSRLLGRLSPRSREHLDRILRGVVPDVPRRTHPAFAHVRTRVIATNRTAVDAAVAEARDAGVGYVEAMPKPLAGDAAERGAALAQELIALKAQNPGRSACRVWGGETTVRLLTQTPAMGMVALGDHVLPARGGRCQELALAAARVLAGAGEAAEGITLLAAGTDGRDGPTDAAGACIDHTTWNAIAATGRDPAAALATHDSYAALDAVGALVRTGATGTNVADVVVGLTGGVNGGG